MSEDFDGLGISVFQSDGIIQGYENIAHSRTMKEAYDYLKEFRGWRWYARVRTKAFFHRVRWVFGYKLKINLFKYKPSNKEAMNG